MVATVITKTIGATGRDYASLALWEAAIPADLVAANEQWVGEVYNDSEFVISTGFVINTRTVDATRNIILKAAAGQSFRDHANVLTNPLVYTAANGVGVRWTSGYGQAYGPKNDFTETYGIQFYSSSTAGTTRALYTATHQNLKFDDCLFQSREIIAMCYSSSAGQGGIFTNCAFITNSTNPTGDWAVEGQFPIFRNCTFYSVAGGAHVVHSPYGGASFYNCLFLGFASWENTDTRNHTVENCVTDLASWQNTTAVNSILSATAANEIEGAGVTFATTDVRLKAGAQSIDAGQDLSAYLTDDIAKQTRGAIFDVGCWEIVAGGGAIEENISLGLSLSMVNANNVLFSDGIVMAMAAGTSQGDQAALSDNTSFGLTASIAASDVVSLLGNVAFGVISGISVNNTALIQDAVAIGVTSGYQLSDNITALEAITLPVVSGITATSVASLIAQITMGIASGIAISDGTGPVDEAVSFNLAAGIQSNGLVFTDDGIALNLSIGYTTADAVSLQADITVGLSTALLSSGNVTLQDAMTIGVQVGQAAATTVTSQLTPNTRRTFTVSPRSNISTPSGQARTFSVSVSSRRRDT